MVSIHLKTRVEKEKMNERKMGDEEEQAGQTKDDIIVETGK